MTYKIIGVRYKIKQSQQKRGQAFRQVLPEGS